VSQPLAVTCRLVPEGFACDVSVGSDESATHHTVLVSQGDLERFAPGHYDPGELVKASFDYLLEREPREAILRRFELPVIERYFPGYEAQIRRQMQR
jgi:hypothetical protein